MKMEYFGIIGAIFGLILGIGGTVFGTWCGIRSTKGPREHKMMVRGSIIILGGVLLFCALAFVLPGPYRYFIWIPYGLLMTLGIVKFEHLRRRVRKEEMETSQT